MPERRADIFGMTYRLIVSAGLIVALALGAADGASAQVGQIPVAPGVMLPPPPPPPPPSPKIEVPVVPKMDQPLPLPQANIRSRGSSFSDRVARCLDDGAAAGLNTAQRSQYAGVCANN
jgi:hypothetical protein